MKRNHRWNEINGLLDGKEIFLLGGGTSLTGFDLSRLNGRRVLAINHAIEHYQNAWGLIFGDKIFLSKTTFDLTKYKGFIFCSERCDRSRPIEQMIGQDNLYIFDDRRDEPILNAKMGLFHPTSSGLLAISLALQMKAKKIYLLGFDYYFKGNMHFYQDYDHHKKNKIERFQMKLKKFKYFEKWAGRIVNLNPQSAIQEFKKVPIDSVL